MEEAILLFNLEDSFYWFKFIKEFLLILYKNLYSRVYVLLKIVFKIQMIWQKN